MRAAGAGLAGRDRELELFRRELNEPAGRILEIGGDPGMGKTRLLAELGKLADRAGWRVLAGRATQRQRDIPHAVLADLVGGRARTTASLRGVLTEVCRASRTVLLLDDFHWADASSAGVLRDMFAEAGLPLVVAVAYRPRQMRGRVPLDGAGIDLGPLAPADADELLGPIADPWRRRLLVEASGGVPAYLMALAHSAATSDALTHPGDYEIGAVGGPLVAEIGALDGETLVVAQSAALIGDPFEAAPVAAVAELGLETTERCLRDLAERDLIRPAGAGHAFRHPVVRGTAHGMAGAGWRLAAHGRAADFLRTRAAPAAVLARHVAVAGRQGDRDAFDVLTEAAIMTSRARPALAVRWWSAAATLSTNDDARTHALCAQADALTAIGEFGDAHGLVQGLLRSLPTGSPERTRAIRLAAFLDEASGRPREAAAMLAAELHQRPGTDPEVRRLAVDRALITLLHGGAVDPQEAEGELGELIVQTLHAAHGVNVIAARTCLRRVDGALAGLADPDLTDRIELLWHAGRAAFVLERDDDAIRYARRGLTVSAQSGRSYVLPQLLLTVAAAHVRLGRPVEALDALRAVHDQLPVIARADVPGIAGALRAFVELGRGNARGARRYAEAAVAATRSTVLEWACLPETALAAVRLATGDALGCLRVLDERAGTVGSAELCALASEAAAALGQGDRARGWAREAGRIADACALTGARSYAHLAYAHVARAAGDTAATAAEAHAAAAGFAALGWRAASDRARTLAGSTGTAVEPTPGGPGLSRREREIEELVARGLSNRQIAEVLFLSIRTVEAHVARILQKTGLRSRAAIAGRLADATRGR
ncbi:LuxR C-terminal-related transcriptional regulator [Krasilnikovia sp. MM14-A1004]|uniref:LuxR C-terminal-related transcriptional regulator n=1 Tax=Krasilnikovia sp. MM14-A1004 TaxID=3373541 RepID=UPI00399CE38F